MAKHKQWIVTASGKRSIHDVAKDLREAGMRSLEVLGEMGVVTGTAPDAAVTKLRKVKGVKDVSADVPVDVGPPGSPKTW